MKGAWYGLKKRLKWEGIFTEGKTENQQKGLLSVSATVIQRCKKLSDEKGRSWLSAKAAKKWQKVQKKIIR